MSKIVFGAYLYINETGKYQYNPTMLGLFEKEQIEMLKDKANVHIIEDDNGVKSDYDVGVEHTSFISNVQYTAIAMIPNMSNVGVQTNPGFSMSDALASYIESIAKDMTIYEDKWNNILHHYSGNSMDNILSKSAELKLLVNELNKNKSSYYNTIELYQNPFVPYKNFIESFFMNCNFYDILPMLEKRLELFNKISCNEKAHNRRL